MLSVWLDKSMTCWGIFLLLLSSLRNPCRNYARPCWNGIRHCRESCWTLNLTIVLNFIIVLCRVVSHEPHMLLFSVCWVELVRDWSILLNQVDSIIDWIIWQLGWVKFGLPFTTSSRLVLSRIPFSWLSSTIHIPSWLAAANFEVCSATSTE